MRRFARYSVISLMLLMYFVRVMPVIRCIWISIEEVMSSVNVQAQLDRGRRFFFGNQEYPGPEREPG